MPEGNEVHRYADLQTPLFAGRLLKVSSPNKVFNDARLLDAKKLRSIEAYGKHLLYDFGADTILHIHLGRFGKFRDGEMPFPPPQGASIGWNCAAPPSAKSSTKKHSANSFNGSAPIPCVPMPNQQQQSNACAKARPPSALS